mgnify:CR=1 FL=1
MIEHIHIPTILLADDTTLLSGTQFGWQQMLNIVNEYAYATQLRALIFYSNHQNLLVNIMSQSMSETQVPMKGIIIHAELWLKVKWNYTIVL